MRYAVRYVHKISPRETDTHEPIELPANAGDNRRTMAKALRDAGVLSSGTRLDSFRVEPDSRIVAFPMGCIWHSVILTPIAEPEDDANGHGFYGTHTTDAAW